MKKCVTLLSFTLSINYYYYDLPNEGVICPDIIFLTDWDRLVVDVDIVVESR